jgi:hypothetical protein
METAVFYSTPDPNTPAYDRRRDDVSREVESLLWLAAGAAWALVALRAWSEARKADARRRVFAVSERLLRQVFPHGIRP